MALCPLPAGLSFGEDPPVSRGSQKYTGPADSEPATLRVLYCGGSAEFLPNTQWDCDNYETC